MQNIGIISSHEAKKTSSRIYFWNVDIKSDQKNILNNNIDVIMCKNVHHFVVHKTLHKLLYRNIWHTQDFLYLNTVISSQWWKIPTHIRTEFLWSAVIFYNGHFDTRSTFLPVRNKLSYIFIRVLLFSVSKEVVVVVLVYSRSWFG